MAEDHVNSPTEYQLMEEEISSSTEKIYILTSSPLPSHIRSVEVKHSSLVPDLSPVYCSSRTINIILILVFVFVTSLTVSIAIYKITEITEPHNKIPSIKMPDLNSSEEPLQLVMTTERENSSLYLDSNTTAIYPSKMVRNCAHKCPLYVDKKFKPDCVFGRCVCRGENYQFLTCLPSVGQCAISKGFFPFVNFSLDNIATPVYSCRPDSHLDGIQLHVLSLYGNHYAKSTDVYVTGESTEPVTLVLANYYPISWKVKYEGVNIQSVILASQFNVGSSDVEITPYSSDKKTVSKPRVRTMQIPVGFGNDIHSSKTVEMLKLLSARVGTVQSFTGADYADYISVRINADS